DTAAANGHLSLLKLKDADAGLTFTVDAVDDAAAHGYVDVVKFLHARGLRGSPAALSRAAEGGHLTTVQLLFYSGGYTCTTAAIEWAAVSDLRRL
ncbi:unnamed protein product, partial [Phaeothamnion confervicola]